jgi:hypothetical protein
MLKNIIKFLDSGTLVDAFMWTLENISDNHPQRTEVFFYLRNRYRNEVQK